ncbi:hypothetical protein [Streptacidiphilus anmyonensis]|uniref:hypothetical protein n=1 Tax=Streptacidiphilus anmyonensis TaxID=405782 RepID=UPI0005AA94B5|nr:hypothetical protein [Streptacidiphilus anmyonensis]
MSGLDPELAAQLRELSEARVRAQVASAKQRADQRRQTRAEFSERRQVGVEHRNGLRAARLRIADHHQQKGTQP